MHQALEARNGQNDEKRDLKMMDMFTLTPNLRMCGGIT